MLVDNITILIREARSLTEITSSLTTAAIRISGYEPSGAGAAGPRAARPLGEAAGAVVCACETPQSTIIRTQNQRIPFMDRPSSVPPLANTASYTFRRVMSPV